MYKKVKGRYSTVKKADFFRRLPLACKGLDIYFLICFLLCKSLILESFAMHVLNKLSVESTLFSVQSVHKSAYSRNTDSPAFNGKV